MSTQCMPHVVAVRVIAPYGREIRCNDEKVRRFDLGPALRGKLSGPVFQPLLDPAYVAQA